MEKLLAVDVALIPPKEILEWAVSLNCQLSPQPNPIPLDVESCVPHITLAMTVVQESALPSLQEELETLAQTYGPVRLETTSPYCATTPEGKLISGLGMPVSDRVRNLHRASLSLLEEHTVKRFDDLSVLYEGQNADPLTLDFIRAFPQKSTHEKFFPHITVGFGQVPTVMPKPFIATNLSLYHLGNYCTCRRLIAPFTLSGLA